VEIVYAITSQDYRAADPRLLADWLQVLADWLQGHWAIENSVHHVRDVTHGEDASRIRTATGPQLMAALRNTDLNLARLRGETNIAASQRRNAWAGATAADIVNARVINKQGRRPGRHFRLRKVPAVRPAPTSGTTTGPA
jgi:hypothetical protein